ncbi:DNA topoisomerase IV subunit A ParC [Psychroflexus torquis ATCC 700755]|uniref:DNA topoisomerase IV subunit A ParC n=1 Tax=Psychroflexus torquis (strain ATCC 700755 / CIP 106069 / ACAM 623) TaxID=313595 RepID=K4IIN0_PSYTT|nr:DNA gyrase/topoisomerase IV subunit A [Psychroflexus torquis]AFU70417.1 DNA topoisomerase IV subunit A ParC [Psychroflexus torquis ATCC 700755]
MSDDLDLNPESQEPFDPTAKDESVKVTGMFQEWFLDYASYVILERAVPAIEDGFKPVHRRILHSMKDLDDGRYTKVANIVGHTMQYHPHGDASIGDAIVQIGQKDILIDTQGNWGNILTGDRAAASRYIEARLSKFALEVVFNPKTTEWQISYDGRKQEPVNLPVKFPMVLAQGAEGIAVGLSTKILPHNFIELIDASIKHLEGKRFTIFPDFATGGIADVSNYNDGLRGGKIRVRATIEVKDKNLLVINEIPYSTNTSTLIDSILKANDKGKIKIKKIEDNTSSDVEILVHLPNNISPDKTIDALFAFTNCEVSISPLSCVIIDDKPHFLGMSELLRMSTENTVELLKTELEIKLGELEEQWHFASLEKIFIEKRIYRDIEEEETWDGVIDAIDRGLQPHIKHLKRDITRDDISRLTEIRIKRISKFDLDKADQKIEALEADIEAVKQDLDHLIDYSINYFKMLKEKYGKGKERKTRIQLFEDIEASKVVIRNTKLYVNRIEGFIGTSMKKDEYVTDCSDIDDIICFTEDGTMMVSKVEGKTFIGKNILYVGIFKKKDKRTIYNLIYKDGKAGFSHMKRFAVTSITRDKAYSMGNDKPGTKVLYFSCNPNGEAELVTVFLRQKKGLKRLKFDIDFSDLAIKGRNVKGNLVSKMPIKSVDLKEEGVSTLKPRKIWFDEAVRRLNVDERGELLGAFKGEDRLLIIRQNGIAKTIIPELTTRFENDIIVMEKWNSKKPISLVYWEGEKEKYYVKRFQIDNADKEELIITEHPNSQLEVVSTDYIPRIEIEFKKTRGKDRRSNEVVNLEDFISIKGIKAQGNQLTSDLIKQIDLIEPLPSDKESEEAIVPETEDKKEDNQQSSLFD